MVASCQDQRRCKRPALAPNPCDQVLDSLSAGIFADAVG
jgi:hypothetical protein